METMIVFAPLIGAILSGLIFRKMDCRITYCITVGGLLLSFILSCIAFYHVALHSHVVNITLFEWIRFESFTSNWSIYIDTLTAIMLIVVTFVSLLVHIYSIGYMSHDEHRQRFFSYLSLFTFFMLVLVTGDNMLQTFVGWEGVGLSSYLLIGFWFEKKSANDAAIKAFIANRVGDLALIIGICAIYYTFGTLNYTEIFAKVNTISINQITFICIALFIGCMGKSAQIGLHVWLPDAMEGPTPVSALIHAATMVTAGVFLVAKCSPLYECSEIARNLIMIVGAITSIFAASIALVQTDIKKIIAYSTCSQLGYMFFACGASMYTAGIFHLATHAFFKALLFLSAGSVIHAMSNEQNIFKMGGLMKKIPLTFTCFMVGSIAIAGLPPLSGFFSKDAILESAFARGEFIGQFVYYVGIIVAFMTSFYSWRLLSLVFHGNAKNHDAHPHESPFIMLVPLFLLGLFSIIAGYIGEHYLHILDPNSHFWNGAIAISKENHIYESIHHIPLYIKILPLILSVLAVCLAYWFYLVKKSTFEFVKIKKILINKYYIDELYDYIFIKPLLKLSNFYVNFFDKRVVDNAIVKIPTLFIMILAGISSKIHAGKISFYLLFMISFIVLTLDYIVLMSFGQSLIFGNYLFICLQKVFF